MGCLVDSAGRAQSQAHELTLNPIIYSERSLMYESIEALDETMATICLKFAELPKAGLFLAAKAFIRYRRAGDTKQNVLADFFIGGHAAVAGCGVLTRDPAQYRSYFPTGGAVYARAGNAHPSSCGPPEPNKVVACRRIAA